MKKYLYILLVSVFVFSCNSSKIKELTTEQNNLKKTAESKMDSIRTGYGGYIIYDDTIKLTSLLSRECRSSRPFNYTNSKDPLGDLFRNDTLKLSAEFSQCGEFGGNKEYILIYRTDTSLESFIIRDSVVCRYNGHGKKYFRISKRKYSLSKNSINAIVDYLELLLRYSLRDKEWHANVAGYFSASITREKDYRKDFSIDLYDTEFRWIYFDILKKEIITTANKG